METTKEIDWNDIRYKVFIAGQEEVQIEEYSSMASVKEHYSEVHLPTNDKVCAGNRTRIFPYIFKHDGVPHVLDLL